MPNGQIINLYDCPGFKDSNKFESLISNCYYVYITFLNIPKNKFVLVIQESALDSGLAGEFTQSIQLFLNLFEIQDSQQNTQPTLVPAMKKITVREIADRTIMVITKARVTSKFNHIVGKIQTRVVD
jgi:hypothetical protein